MKYLLDTNILVRRVNLTDPQNLVATASINVLLARGATPILVPQVLVELSATLTRPGLANGLGMTHIEVSKLVDNLRRSFTLLPDNELVFEHWLRFFSNGFGIGREVYDM